MLRRFFTGTPLARRVRGGYAGSKATGPVTVSDAKGCDVTPDPEWVERQALGVDDFYDDVASWFDGLSDGKR